MTYMCCRARGDDMVWVPKSINIIGGFSDLWDMVIVVFGNAQNICLWILHVPKLFAKCQRTHAL
jgi:hypothetical protein